MFKLSICLFWLLITLPSKAQVDTWIGTGGTIYSSGMAFPGATTPFGLVRLSPDTEFGFPLRALSRANVATAGYYNSQHRIIGFSHTRLEGAGLKEGGAFRVLPMPSPSPKIAKKGLRLKKKYERATPGYYSVIFPSSKISAEFTATTHCGVHRYVGQDSLTLLLNPDSNLSGKKNEQTQIEINSNVISGSTHFQGDFSRRYGGQPIFFYAELSQAPDKTFRDEHGQWLVWEKRSTVELRLCLSTVKAENAHLNFLTELKDNSFEDIRNQAKSQWEAWLNRIQIKSASSSVSERFYSALYRTGIMPTTYSDVNGEYRTFQNTIGKTTDFKYLTDLSLWDTFRTTHPLYTLIAPEIQRSSLLSMLEMAKFNNNRLPLWPAGSGDGASMFGYPAHFLFAESWAKDQKSFEPFSVLSMMANQALDPNSPCVLYTYCPVKLVGNSVSQTLERAWANGVTADFARSLGETQLASHFAARSLDFKNLWNKKFFAPRTEDGSFKKFYPLVISYLDFLKLNSKAYAEGTPHQWRYSVPHRPKELIELFGGEDTFVSELNSFMEGASGRVSAIYPGPLYWHGNEHDFHALYLFNEAGRPDLTQKWARWALETRYSNSANGLDGNDDGGALSAWYVFSALGLYPQAGTANYWIGSPIVNEATLNLGEGRILKIIAENNSPDNIYLQEVYLNGKQHCSPVVKHQELLNGTLKFIMGKNPALLGGFNCSPSKI